MFSQHRIALQSWIVVGLVLAVVLVSHAHQTPWTAASGEKAHLMTLLGQGRRSVPAGQFHGADVTVVMGGGELDLRSTTMGPGDEMVVDVLAVMGGVVIRVPDGWTVDARTVQLGGGVRDKRLRPFAALEASIPVADNGPAPRLVLRGAVVMGGLVIKS